MSFVTRKGAGVGEGDGSGVGDGLGEGTWARAEAMLRCGVASAAAPRAGTSFTNLRRFKPVVSVVANGFLSSFFFDSDFFIVFWSLDLFHVARDYPPATAGGTDLSLPCNQALPHGRASAYCLLLTVFHLEEFSRAVALNGQNV